MLVVGVCALWAFLVCRFVCTRLKVVVWLSNGVVCLALDEVFRVRGGGLYCIDVRNKVRLVESWFAS